MMMINQNGVKAFLIMYRGFPTQAKSLHKSKASKSILFLLLRVMMMTTSTVCPSYHNQWNKSLIFTGYTVVVLKRLGPIEFSHSEARLMPAKKTLRSSCKRKRSSKRPIPVLRYCSCIH